MASPCAKHPHQPLVGVCGACLREKLALCMNMSGFLQEIDGVRGSEATSDGSNEAFGSPTATRLKDSAAWRDLDRRKLSDYVGDVQGLSSDCHAQASSCCTGATYKENSFYSSHHYIARGRGERGCLRGPSCAEENPSSSRRFNGRGPFLWLSGFFLPRKEAQHREDRKEGSIAPWRSVSCCKRRVSKGEDHQHDSPSPCTHSFSSEAPSSATFVPWAQTQLSKSPSLLSSQSAKSLSQLSPLMLASPPLFSYSTRSPSRLQPSRGSPRSVNPPLLSYPRTPLNLSCLISPKPGRTCSDKLHAHRVSPQRRSTHGDHLTKKETMPWFGVFLRNKWVVRLKRRFAKKQKQEDAESVRTSSVKESDCCSHSLGNNSLQPGQSQNQYWFTERDQFRSPILRRSSRAGSGAEQRWGRGGGREHGDAYFSNNFNGVLRVRHRHPSADSAELLRLYLTPVGNFSWRFRGH